MSVMHDRQSTLKDFPKARQVKVKPLHQINGDSFSSAVAPLKEITMLWYLLTNVPDTDGFME